MAQPESWNSNGAALRLAVFSVVPWGFDLLREWARDAGHEIVALVTSPVRTSGPGSANAVAARADPSTFVMIAPSVGDCSSVLEKLDVDLGLIFGFSKIPSTLAGLPEHGILNLHPALLPAWRGPNAYRALYEGEERIGATLHRIVEEFDAGPVLARAECDVPRTIDPETVMAAWLPTLTRVLDEGVPRATADEAGEPQPQGTTMTAVPFSEEEEELTFTVPVRLLQAQVTALLMGGRQPRARIGGEPQFIRALRLLPGLTAAEPGLVNFTSRRAIVAATDGVVEVEIGKLPY